MMYFQYMTNLAPPWCINPDSKGHEFHIFGKGFIDYYIHVNSLSAWCPRLKKKNFEDCVNFNGFGHTLLAPGRQGPRNSQIFPLHP